VQTIATVLEKRSVVRMFVRTIASTAHAHQSSAHTEVRTASKIIAACSSDLCCSLLSSIDLPDALVRPCVRYKLSMTPADG
jgi:hypothetical protein